MSKTYDKDIHPVLEKASNEELAPLVAYVKKKFSVSLTRNDIYKKYAPDHSKYSEVIAEELCRMGGNSFANLFRGRGPTYHEIVCDVADKLSVKYYKAYSIERIEEAVVVSVFQSALEKMSDKEREAIKEELGIPNFTTDTLSLVAGPIATILARQLASAVLGRAILYGGAGATFAQTAALLTGPVGWLLSGAWAAFDVSGPAYSVTIPSVVHVAMLRKAQREKVEKLNELKSDIEQLRKGNQNLAETNKKTFANNELSEKAKKLYEENAQAFSDCEKLNYSKCLKCGSVSKKHGANFCTSCGAKLHQP